MSITYHKKSDIVKDREYNYLCFYCGEVDILKIEKKIMPDTLLVEQLRALESKCNAYDKIQSSACIDVSMNYYEDMNSIFLMYEEDKLISFISVFAPLKHEIEICGFTDPEYRQKGYFSMLLKEVINEANKFNIKDLLFVFDGKFSHSEKLGKKLNAKLYLTEYFLTYSFKDDKCNKLKNKVVIKEVQHSTEFPIVIDLDKRIFKEDEDVAISMAKAILASETRSQYVCYHDKKPIGMINVDINNDEAMIFGLGVLSEYRGRGYAKDMLCLLIHELKKVDISSISLEVDSNNPEALALYMSCGFEKVNSFEYYRMDLHD